MSIEDPQLHEAKITQAQKSRSTAIKSILWGLVFVVFGIIIFVVRARSYYSLSFWNSLWNIAFIIVGVIAIVTGASGISSSDKQIADAQEALLNTPQQAQE